MYTTVRDDVYDDEWIIRDPDGIYVCTVTSQTDAYALLTHLNRN